MRDSIKNLGGVQDENICLLLSKDLARMSTVVIRKSTVVINGCD